MKLEETKIKEMKAEITKEFEAGLDDQKLKPYEITKAKFICEETLEHCANDEQIMDMYAFILYSRQQNPPPRVENFPGGVDGYIRFTINHDIYGLFNYDDSLFSPRTSRYRDMLSPLFDL